MKAEKRLGLVYDAQRHFQKYFRYIMTVSRGTRSTQRKPHTCHKSLTNVIT